MKFFIGNAGGRDQRVPEPPAKPRGLPRLLVDVSTAAWKLRMKIRDPQTGEPREEMRALHRHVDTIWDALAEAGIEIQDHTGQPFATGQSLEVLAFQPMAGVEAETVIETVRPSIYLRGRRLQMGQVIVGAPQSEDGDPTT